MNCPDCQNQFSDFIDDEISLKMARSVEGHLAACPACTAEWQLFKQTVTTLQNFPSQRVPADFIIGINEKLSPQSFFKIKSWLSFMSQHKLPATTALATLMVGVISAAVLQLSPLASDHALVQRHSSDNPVMQAMTVAPDSNNYYPGIPYLAGNSKIKQPRKPLSLVQVTPVKQSAPNTAYNSIWDSRGSPTLSNTASPYPSLSRLGIAPPDMIITVHANSTSYQRALMHQLTANRNWKTQISGNTLLVTLPSGQLTHFQQLFGPVDPHINPVEFSRLSNSSPSSLLTVAVAFH